MAEVNDETILLSDLSEASKQELFDLLNMAYEIKSKVLARSRLTSIGRSDKDETIGERS